MLPIDRDALVHQRLEVDAVQIAVDADIDTPMQHAFLLKARTDAHVAEKIGRPVLDQPSANAIFNVFATAVFDND